MQNNDRIRLKHMLKAAKEALSFATDRSREDLNEDRMFTLSLLKAIEMIGEAASKITEDCRKAYPEIPWRDIVAMRNRLIHVYFEIDLDRVWDTITDDLPDLVAALEKIIPDSA